METLQRDVRYAVRTSLRTQRFSVPAIGALALGSGLGLALLMLADRGLSRPGWAPPPIDAPLWERGWSPAARAIAQLQAESLDALLWILGAATLLVLVVVCINLGMLLLARAAARQLEVTLRAVLGAGRSRLGRQLLTESGVLCLLGAALGFIVCGVALAILHTTWPAALPRWLARGPSLAATGLAVGLPALFALGFGLMPLRVAARDELARSLTTGERATPGPHEGIVRGWLISFAVAASVALLVGAGLLLRSFAMVGGAQVQQLGYDPTDTLALRLDFAQLVGAGPAGLVAAQAAALARMAALPGVKAASLASAGAWVGIGTEDRVRAVCGDCSRGNMWLPVTEGVARHHVVSPGYFGALGIPVLRGREFTDLDDAVSPRVAVISRTFMNGIFTGRDPLGKPIQIGGPDGEWYTVIGVVGEVRGRGLGTGSEPVAALYLSTLQHPARTVGLAVRTAGDPLALAPAVEAALQEVESSIAVNEPTTLEAELARTAAPLRWFAGIFAALAGFAALVAAVGLFGVVTYTVARRTREMGVRLALGARPHDLVRLVVGQSLRTAGTGMWLGLLAALSLARLLQVLFLGVSPLDPLVYGTVVALVLGVALLASYLPARRAARVDPIIALRAE